MIFYSMETWDVWVSGSIPTKATERAVGVGMEMGIEMGMGWDGDGIY